MNTFAMVTRWDQWFSDDNLSKDTCILTAPHSQAAESAAEAFLAREKRSVLDLACGVGRDTCYLASHGLAVVGVDASFNGLRVVKRIQSGQDAAAQLAMADARHLPFQDASFDGVYCFGLLHEFAGERKEQDVREVMSEIRRVLRDGGVLVLTVLSGKPEAGLPAVQLFSGAMFGRATQGWRAIEVRMYDDIGCTGRTDYHIWYGMFEK